MSQQIFDDIYSFFFFFYFLFYFFFKGCGKVEETFAPKNYSPRTSAQAPIRCLSRSRPTLGCGHGFKVPANLKTNSVGDRSLMRFAPQSWDNPVRNLLLRFAPQSWLASLDDIQWFFFFFFFFFIVIFFLFFMLRMWKNLKEHLDPPKNHTPVFQCPHMVTVFTQVPANLLLWSRFSFEGPGRPLQPCEGPFLEVCPTELAPFYSLVMRGRLFSITG